MPVPETIFNYVLETSIVQQELRESLFEDFHAVAEVGKVGHYIVVYLLYAGSPVCGEVSH